MRVDDERPRTPGVQRQLAAALKRHRWSIAGLCLAFGAYLIVAVGGVLVRAPLGHDEAVYAMRARDFASGWSITSGDYWAEFRAPGLPILLAVTNWFVGMHVVTMRLAVVATGGVLLLVTWLIGRHLGLGNGAAVAPFLMTICVGFAYTTSNLLADVPGAAFGVVAVAVYLVEVDRGRLRWSMIVVPLAAAGGTIARFGVPIMIGAGLTAAFAVALPKIWRRRNWVVVAQSVCLAVGAGLVIRLVLFTDLLLSGSLSPADANRSLATRKGLTPSSGFEDLRLVLDPWSSWPVPLWSKAVAVVFVFGLVAGLVTAFLPGGRPRAVVFGVLAGLISLVGVTATVGLVVANYLALSLPFWAIAAAAGYLWIGERCAALIGHRPWPRVLATSFVLLVVGGLVVTTTQDNRELYRQQEITFAVLRDVSVDTGQQLGADCVVVTGSAPQVGYYSGCRVVKFRGLESEDLLSGILAESLREATIRLEPDPPVGGTAVLIREQGKRQPSEALLSEADGIGPRISEVGLVGQGGDHVWSSRVLLCVWDGSC